MKKNDMELLGQLEASVQKMQQLKKEKWEKWWESTQPAKYPEGDLGKMFQEMDKKQDETFMKIVMGPQPISLLDTPKSPYHRILVIGDSGTGKTHFAGTMPKPFVADFDSGLSTLRGKDVKALTFGPLNWRDFREEITRWKKETQYDCQTFVVDSFTMAADAALTHVLNKNGRSGQQPTVQDWGEAIREVKDVLAHITTLPCNVLVIAHSQLVKDELIGDLQFLPLIYGKDLPHRLGIYFDEVYMTTVVPSIKNGAKTNDYKLQVKPDSRMKILKSRMNTDGKLFDLYEEPDFAHLVAKTEGAKPAEAKASPFKPAT